MTIEPLPKRIYDHAVASGVRSIELNFSGGSDEGYLTVSCVTKDGTSSALEIDVEDWAWEVYEYGGDGDGSGDYGDDIVYNIEARTATHTDWWLETTTGEPSEEPFELVEEVES